MLETVVLLEIQLARMRMLKDAIALLGTNGIQQDLAIQLVEAN